MPKVPVFYSFHFANDVMRVQQIRNIGALDGNTPTSANAWEEIRRTGDRAVQNWIDNNMKYRRCVVVLIGSETATRPWVSYEIRKAWNDGKALLGIHIHNLKCPRGGTCRKGHNPFDKIHVGYGAPLSAFVPCYDPNPRDAYRAIAQNLALWVDNAIATRRNR